MTRDFFPIDRRAWLGGFATALLLPATRGRAQARTTLALEAVVGSIVLRDGRPPEPVWQIAGGPDAGPLRFTRGDTVDVTLTNRLPVPVAPNWIGLDGHPAAEPMTGLAPLAPNASATIAIKFRQSGTMILGCWAIGDAQVRPFVSRPIIVTEAQPLAVDRDDVLLFQDWRVKPDGSGVAPGTDPGDGVTILSVNGQPSFDIIASLNDRLRLRLNNGSQQSVFAVKFDSMDVRVMAIDSLPSEPFLARDGVVVLTPGARVDVMVDVIRPPGSASTITLTDGRQSRPIGRLIVADTKPVRATPLPAPSSLPSENLPAQLDLKSALRIDLPLGTADWLTADRLGPTVPPAFTIKRGRVAVLTLTNRGSRRATFHLHGHHVRLLDRLDDGWKPFWLDTLSIEPGQTQRVAFAALFAGLYPISAIEADRTATRRVRSYVVA